MCKQECVWHRGPAVFVSTPRFEHTCNFLPQYLQCNHLKYASFYIVPSPLYLKKKKKKRCLEWIFWQGLNEGSHKLRRLRRSSPTPDSRWTRAPLEVLIVLQIASPSCVYVRLSPRQHSGHYRGHLTPIIHSTTVTTSRWGNWTQGARSGIGKESEAFCG